MNWMIAGAPRSEVFGAQGPFLLFTYLVSDITVVVSCVVMIAMFVARRGYVTVLIPRSELWVFAALIASFGARYAGATLTLFVGIYWLDAGLVAINAGLAAASGWISVVRLWHSPLAGSSRG